MNLVLELTSFRVTVRTVVIVFRTVAIVFRTIKKKKPEVFTIPVFYILGDLTQVVN
jgi:hypothetical protein